MMWDKARTVGWYAGAGLRHTLAQVTLIFVIMLINPFGAITSSDDRSKAIWEHVYAERYFAERLAEAGGAGTTEPDTLPLDPPGRDASLVITLRDTDWEQLAPARQPTPLDIYDLVQQILSVAPGQGRPRAIFLDMGLGYFAPQDLTLDELTSWTDADVATCLNRSQGGSWSPFRCMTILFGELTQYKIWSGKAGCSENTVARLRCIESSGGIALLFADTRAGANVSPVADRGFEALDAIGVLVPVGYQNAAEYPLADHGRDGVGGDLGYRLHPAAALYAIYCGIDRPDPRRSTAGGLCAKPPFVRPSQRGTTARWRSHYWPWSKSFDSPAAVVWGVGGDSRFTDELIGITRRQQSAYCHVAGGFGLSALELARQFASGFNVTRGDPCLYPRMITYEQLGRLTPTLAHMALDDRIVIVGDASAQAADVVQTALHGPVHGALWHAMALDNLISFGVGYPKVPIRLFGLSITDHDLLNLLAATAFLIPGSCLIIWIRNRNILVEKGNIPFQGELTRRAAALILALLLMYAVIKVMTGQSSAFPGKYNYAALSIVALLQFASIAGLILRPLWEWLLCRSRVLMFFFGDGPPRRFRRRDRRSEGRSDAGGSDIADAGSARGGDQDLGDASGGARR